MDITRVDATLLKNNPCRLNLQSCHRQYALILLISLFFSTYISSTYASAQENTKQVFPVNTTNLSLDTAISFADQGDVYYKQKDYNRAIKQYIKSLNYLDGDEKNVQKQLGDVFTGLAETYKRLNNREKTVYYYKKAVDVYTAIGSKKYMARTLSTLAQAERYLGNYVVALDYATLSLEIHDEINDPSGRVKALNSLGIIYRTIGRYEKSFEYHHEAYLYYKKVNDPTGIANASNQIGLIYTKLKQFDLARSFYQVTIDLAKKQIPVTTLASALREMAVIDYNAGNYDSAMIMVKKAHKIYQTENDNSKQPLTARIIANIFREQKDYDNAEDYYRQSLSKAIEVRSTTYQIKAQTPLANILIGTNSDEAVSLLKNSIALANKINDKSQLLYAYRSLRKAEENRKNYQQSLQYAKQEIALSKTINEDKNNKKITLTKANLHSYKLEMDVASLKEKLTLEQLALEKKNNEIILAHQAKTINELELLKNQLASIALASLLIICMLFLVFMYRKSIDSKAKNKELDYLASRDPLTNCYNRRSLFNIMKEYFSTSDLNGEYCIIMIDIDHFKRVNDTYGHCAGDTVIQGVANVLQHGVRQNDIVARIGGEEFCIILNFVPQDKAIAIAEKMRKKIENTPFNDISVTASFGVTSIKFEAKRPSELINQADLALYQSKETGRNKVSLWNTSLQDNQKNPSVLV